jgi:hypothetical protein
MVPVNEHLTCVHSLLNTLGGLLCVLIFHGSAHPTHLPLGSTVNAYDSICSVSI